MSLRVAGRNPSGKHLELLQKSPQYNNNGFQNLSDTPMMSDDASYWKMIKNFFGKNNDKIPSAVLPSVKTDLKNILASQPVITWFGHSSYFIRIHGKNILVDPVFSGSASPVSIMIRSFAGSDVYTLKDMPDIDYLILTHDHYDHLDFKTILGLKKKVSKVYCSLGMSSHLFYWGIDKSIVTELDWWQSAEMDGNIELTAAPARHFSGRGVKRFRTLWSSFVLKTATHTLYLGGDSGYDTHFKTIGDKYGPFDIVLLESGQYNEWWPLIHMMPEETVRAAADLKARVLLPVHWGKFALAMHKWNEPVIRVLKKAEELKMKVTTPMIGEMVIVDESYPDKNWWNL